MKALGRNGTQSFCWSPSPGMGSRFSPVITHEDWGGSGCIYFAKCPAAGPAWSGCYICPEGGGVGKKEGEEGKTWSYRSQAAADYHITTQCLVAPDVGAYCAPAAPHVLFFTYQEHPTKWLLSSFYRWKVES